MWNGYESFKKYEVKVDSLEEFLVKYTKRDRHYGRGEEYAQHRYNSYAEELVGTGAVLPPGTFNTANPLVPFVGQPRYPPDAPCYYTPRKRGLVTFLFLIRSALHPVAPEGTNGWCAMVYKYNKLYRTGWAV